MAIFYSKPTPGYVIKSPHPDLTERLRCQGVEVQYFGTEPPASITESVVLKVLPDDQLGASFAKPGFYILLGPPKRQILHVLLPDENYTLDAP